MVRKLLLASAAMLAATGAQAEWYKASSKHFVVYADDREENVRAFTARLERFDKAIRVWHMAKEDVRGPSARVTVFLLNDTDAIQRLAGNRNVAGFYEPRAGASVAFSPRTGSGDLSATAILFHEYTHHWMLSTWTDAALPPWFVEGFAELHATALFRGEQVIFGAVPSYRSYTIGRMNLLPMDRMLRFDLGTLSDAETDALYSHGWALTHYLTFDPERRKLLAEYVGALNSGKPVNPSMLVEGGGNLDLKLNSYVRRPSLPSAAFGFDQLPIGPVEVTKLGAAEAAMMPAIIVSERGVDKKSAPQAAALARKLAAPFPNDPVAQNELAEAEYDLCDSDDKGPASCFATAEAAADRALAADPKSIHAMLYKGLAQTAALKRGKVADAARWTAARRWFLSANKVDTEAPQPLIAFYDSFADAGAAPSANAQAALLYAYVLAPYDGALRTRATRVYLAQNKLAEAKIAIAPVAYSVGDGDLGSSKAQKVLKAIEAGDAKAAIAELDTKAEPKTE